MTPPFQLASTPLQPGVTLLEASAGTGKTFTIAGLVLRLLVEQRLSIGEILVVTFTEAATAELRGRIRERLAQARQTLRVGASAEPVWAGLLLGGSAADRSDRRALVEAALEQFDDAAVFTIHGFCQRVLQERAFESRALFDAELEPDVTSFQRETADNFWRRHFYEAPGRHVGFAHHAGVTADDLFDLLRTHARQARVTTLARATERSLAAVIAEADAVFAEAGQIWRGERTAITAMFGGAGGEWANQPYNRSDLVEPLFSALDALFAEASPAGDEIDALLRFRQSALNEAKSGKKKKLPVPTHPFFIACDQFAEALDTFGARLRYEFLTTAPAELTRLKDRDRRFGFDDLLSRVADTLAGPSGPPLAKALRRRYRAALIDEFQDTDPVQWSIFEQVFCDGASQLYLVGDPKQAIYSFRGADVFAYLRARGRADRGFTLGENWRSEHGLVTAVNHVWSLNPRPFALTEIGFPPVSSRGAADATPLTEAGDRSAPLRVWFWDAQKDGATNQPRQQACLADAVADEIVRLLTDEVRLGSRRVEPGDIAVLVDAHAQAERVAAALARRRVPSVQRTQQSVFATRAAAEVQSLVEALAGGARDGQRRAALATSLLGVDAVALDALRREDADWESWLDRFARWSDQWERDGFLPMFETVLRDRDTRARLLRRADGERQLTNFLHLGELLQQAAVMDRRSPRALATWLAEQRGRADGSGEATQESLLRLERDAAAVQLVTVHGSKGLEYPVVFCPFLTRKPDRPNAPVLFHDRTDEQALKHDVGSERLDEHRGCAVGETFAENLRLLYVALTRAKHRCYVGWGTLNSSEKAALAWLLHPPDDVGTLALEDLVPTLEQHVKSLPPELRREQVNALARTEIEVCDLPAPAPGPWTPPAITDALTPPRMFHGTIRRDWGMTSFSALAHGRADEAPDRDAVEAPGLIAAAGPAALSDPLATFRGTRAGTCLHDVFEQLDFATATQAEIRALVDDRLRAHGFATEELGDPLGALVGRVLEVELVPGGSLREVPAAACWRELEFLLPLNPVTPAALREAFAAAPRGMPWDDLTASLGRLGFADIEGFLGGFIDLVFRHAGRWWLVDWKSNWLGETPADYGPEALWREMLGQLYPLQYHLYLLALHRLLRLRLPDYDYERDVGGVRYVFVRGVTPGQPELGVFCDRPPLAVIEELERRLLGGPSGSGTNMTKVDPSEASAGAPFSELDWQFAALMERLAGGGRPELRLAAALVSVRRSAGDVCLDLDHAAGRSWLDPAEQRLAAPAVGAWREALRSATAVVGGPGEVKPLILEANDRLYLRRYWVYEQQLTSALRARATRAPASYDPSKLRAGFTRLFPDRASGEINWQQVAAFAAVRSGLSVISGGPGTGKTRTVVRLLALLLELTDGAGLRVAVTAPTGKAAGRLQESIRAAKAELATTAPAVAALSDEVKTIHRLLGTIPDSPYFRHNAANPLPVDVLVVDEASMVDLALMAKLVAALPVAARLVLLGDKDQLASVEAGNVLGDISANPELNRFSPEFGRAFHAISGVSLPERRSSTAPLGDCLVELQHSHRFGGESGIFRVSQAVNRGDVESALAALGRQGPRGKREEPAGEQSVGWRELPARSQMKAALREAVLRGYGEMVRAPDAAEALARLGRFRILAAVREGPQGVVPLNALVEEILREAKLIPRAGGWYAGRQVLITANDYSAKLFNGDLGVAWTSPTGGVDVWFAGPDGAPRRVAPARLPAHESAFALTVHKSQGSEFEEVLLILPERAVPVVTRELLYTGLTRARRRTEVWALEAVFRAAVALRTERTSGLAARLWTT